MRIGWIAIGVVGVIAIGLATVGPSGGPDPGQDASENPFSRVSAAAARGRDVKSGMAVSTNERSMFGQGGQRDNRSIRGSNEPVEPVAARRNHRSPGAVRGGQPAGAPTTTTTGNAQSYRDRQAERAARAAEIAERRAANRNAASVARNRVARTADQTPAVRDRLQDIQRARSNQITGARTTTNQGLIGRTGATTATSTAANATNSSSSSSSSSAKGLDSTTADQLLQQLLSSQAGKNNSGGVASGGNSSNAGSGANSGSGDSGAPIDTTGGGGAAPIVGSGPIVVSSSGLIRANVRWLPVDTGACPDITGYQTNDLYLRLDGADRLVALDSGDASAGIKAVGGGFYQSELGGDLPPDASDIAADPCLAFDSFLDFGGASFVVLTAGGAQFGASTGGTLRATWVSLAGAVGAQNQARFGDTAYYLRLGRFTISNAVTDVSGQILTQLGPAEGGTPETLILTVPHCPDCWGGDVLPNEDDGDSDNDDGSGDGDGDGSDDDGGTGDGTDDGSGDGGTDGGTGDDGGDDGTDDGSDGGTGDDGGDDGTDGGTGDDGGDDGGDGTGSDDGDGDDGDADDGDTDDDEPIGIEAVWLPIGNTCDPAGFDNCESPAGYSTYDLYLRMADPHSFTILDMGDTSSGLEFGMADVWQFAGNTPPKPRPPGLPPACPCREFDSYFAFGNGGFSFLVAPPEDEWLPPLEAVWYADLGTTVQALPEPVFGDDAYYFRIMRLTIEPNAPVGGNLTALGSVFGTGASFGVSVEIPPLP